MVAHPQLLEYGYISSSLLALGPLGCSHAVFLDMVTYTL